MMQPPVEQSVSVSSKILLELLTERLRQNEQWGGPTHDDTHDVDTWVRLIDKQADKIMLAAGIFDADPGDVPSDDFYEGALKDIHAAYIKIAAIAVAALESIDRKVEEWNA